MDRPSWVPSGVDLNQPSVARVYDYYLGGSHNFAADREFARRVLAAIPELPRVLQENRAFLRRAVRHLVDAGIDQFVDLGSGIPTVGNVHEVARAANPGARVVYVDHDPVAVSHSRAILADDPLTTVVPADLTDPGAVLAHPELRRLIDVGRPVAVLLVAVLHFVADGDLAATVVARLGELLAPGSYVAISHASKDGMAEGATRTESLYNQSVTAMSMRTRDEIVALFGKLSIVDPGVVRVPLWRPDGATDPALADYPGYAGLGRVD